MAVLAQIEDPVALARELGPLIREAAAEADSERRLPERAAVRKTPPPQPARTKRRKRR